MLSTDSGAFQSRPSPATGSTQPPSPSAPPVDTSRVTSTTQPPPPKPAAPPVDTSRVTSTTQPPPPKPAARPVDTSRATSTTQPPPPKPAALVDTGTVGSVPSESLPEAPRRGRDDATRPLLERWRSALETVSVESPRHAASLKQGRLLYLRDGEVGLAFRPETGFHRTTVTGQSGRTVVERLLSLHFGRPTRLVVDDSAASAAGKSVAELDAEARAEHERTTGQSVRSHPAILATLRILGGELEHIQVLEHERTGAPGSDLIDEQP